MRFRISWLPLASGVIALAACNEILDNREGFLAGDEPTSETAPTQPAKTDGGSATRPESPDATAPRRMDAATDDAPVDAASACPPGLEGTSKTCGSLCVSVNDPEYGCAAEDCTPCSLASAIPACMNGACAIFTCDPNRADCNLDPTDGCEADLLSPATCGSCENACPAAPHAISTCSGMCTYECEDGWGDCNGDPLDGCETNLADDPTNCGRCGRVCFFGTCTAGQCFLL